MEEKSNYKKKNSSTFHNRKTLCFKTASARSTETLGSRIAREIKKHKIKCVVFFGPFGAGKTTMIRGIIKNLTGHRYISSPSFTIVNEYASKNVTIYHFDFYRIKSCDDLESFGFKEYLNSGILLIEWPKPALHELPEKTLKVSMEFIDLTRRKIRIIFP